MIDASDPLARRRRLAVALVLAFAAMSAVVLVLHGPIAQPGWYHDFADRRPLGPIANAGDVLSNLPFVLVGCLALLAARRSRRAGHERAGMAVYGFGLLATAFGSAWYHLDPKDATLVSDRLPIAVAFTSFAALVIGERTSPRVGRRLLAPLVAAGVLSVLHWAWTLRHAPGGDLRLYLWVRNVPVVAVFLLPLLVATPRRTRGAALATIAGFVLATVLELLDRPIFEALGGAVSGHTLKHLAAAGAAAAGLGWWRRGEPDDATRG